MTTELPIGSFCQTGSGGTPSREREAEFYAGSIPWVKSGELRENLVETTEESITELALRSSSAKLVPSGALLIAMYGATVGRIAMLGIEAATNQAVCSLIPDPMVADSRYLFHALQAKLQHFISRGVGGAQPNISQGIIKETTIRIPSLAEQRRIAAILDQAETLRTKRRHALVKIDTLTQSVFVEQFGDPRSNPRRLPATNLEATCSLVTDGEHLTPRRSPFGNKLLSARNVKDGFLDFLNVDYVDDVEYKRITTRCKPSRGDILISCSGSIGRVAAVRTDEPLCLVRSAALIRPNPTLVLTDYLESWLRLPMMQQMMKSRANASSQANLFQNQIRSLTVLLPSMKEQSDFVGRCHKIRALRASYAQARGYEANLFASLQYRAFRGEL